MNAYLFYSCNTISSLLEQFGLVVEYEKTKVFHFSRLHSIFNSPLLNISYIGGCIIYSKDRNIWDLSLTKNSHFINTSNFIPIKLCLQSSIWKYLETQYVDFFPYQTIIYQVYPFGKHITVRYLLSTSNLKKPAFYSSYFSCNNLEIPFSIWRYFYLTQPSMLESYSCQCWDTKTSAWSNKSYTTETLSISYSIYLYIRLVVIL